MLNQLKKELNKTYTTNNDPAFKSTGSAILDYFSSSGSMRHWDNSSKIQSFMAAYNENNDLALKALFYTRDIKQGQGERESFKTILNHLARNHPQQINHLVPLIPLYGRWDDIFTLKNTPLEDTMLEVVYIQLVEDIENAMENKPCSLLAKWLPSINTSSNETRELAKFFIKKYGMTEKTYRTYLSNLRKHIDVIEKKMSAKEWNQINYPAVPSIASAKYRKAFIRNDEPRYKEYLSKVEKGQAKINTSTIYPYQILMNSGIRFNHSSGTIVMNHDQTLDLMWKNLPNHVTNEDALVMADVSGSMYSEDGRPIAVAISLAMYFAERNKGMFKNHFMTFSGEPKIIEITGETLADKFNAMCKTKWQSNTNLRKALMKILYVAKMNNMSNSDMPSKLYIISDMQFDGCCSGLSTLQDAQYEFELEGLKMPEIVFWSVKAETNKPALKNEKGVQIVSGFNPILFKQIQSGLNAYDLMSEILNSPRYEEIHT